MSKNLEERLDALRAGRMSKRARAHAFGKFVDGTRKEFAAMARYLMRRWTPPPWVTPDDVEQELYLGVWNAIWRYDATRGVTLMRFVVFSAISDAKRTIHKARGVSISGSPDKRPSRFEFAETTLIKEWEESDASGPIARLVETTPPVDEQISVFEETKTHATRAIRSCRRPEERLALIAIREGGGSINNAAKLLYAKHGVELRLGSEEGTEEWILRYASAVADRLAACSMS